MNITELANRLRDMYRNASEGESVCMIHLFGVMFASEIRGSGASCKTIVQAAGISETYVTEVNKGVKLAKYVHVKRS